MDGWRGKWWAATNSRKRLLVIKVIPDMVEGHRAGPLRILWTPRFPSGLCAKWTVVPWCSEQAVEKSPGEASCGNFALNSLSLWGSQTSPRESWWEISGNPGQPQGHWFMTLGLSSTVSHQRLTWDLTIQALPEDSSHIHGTAVTWHSKRDSLNLWTQWGCIRQWDQSPGCVDQWHRTATKR